MIKTIWVCDVCGAEVADNSVSNVTVNLGLVNGPKGVGGKQYDAIVCAKCSSGKKVDEILKGVVVSAQQQTGMATVSSVSFLTLTEAGNVTGVEAKAEVITSIDPVIETPKKLFARNQTK